MSSSRHSHSRPSTKKSSSHTESKHSSKSKGKTSSHSSGAAGPSFYFVVEALDIHPNTELEVDRWGNNIPPYRVFSGESSWVFRYHDGTATFADNCEWRRSPETNDGGIYYQGFGLLNCYSRTTVFNCGPFLPCVVARGDPMVVNEDGIIEGFHALNLTDETRSGISRLSPTGSPRMAAGRDANFIGTLLPTTYKNRIPDAILSRGLGGEFGILIGLMALSQDHMNINNAFNSHWRHNRWRAHLGINAWPTAPGDIRGVSVHIALEPGDDVATQIQTIQYYEDNEVTIRPD
ncbi:hypothetical protein BX600DRAFT_540936 [Xylariales sp. PMI_506]|nr:hypothetical protein BX600DRAFT_540936 [Xylariales sp. PMI_506]